MHNFLCNLAFSFLNAIAMLKFLLILLIFPSLLFSQSSNARYKSELGFMVGGSYYIGDLNQFKHFYNTKTAAGLIYRYNAHSRLSIRGNVSYGNVEAADKDSKKDIFVNRNLSFQSRIIEVAGGVEFNYFPFQLGHNRYKGTAYILAEIGLFQMKPMTELNGDLIELQSLGTEGQGSSLSSKGQYGLTQLTVPLGFGFKVALGSKASFNIEYGIRKTFTDYLDDVASDSYLDLEDLAAENGPLAAQLSNRSLDGSRYGKRGTSATKDWYAFFGASLAFRLGKAGACNQP